MILRLPDLPRRLPAALPALMLVYGDEPLFVTEAADAVRAHLRAQGVDERIRYDGLAEDDIYAEAQAGSLFASRKILEAECPEAKIGATGAKFLKQWLQSPPNDVCLMLVAHCERMPRTTAWMKQVESDAISVRCERLPARELPGWLAQRARQRGVSLTAEAVEWMALRTEGALLAAAQDIDKLALTHPGAEVDPDLLERTVADSARFDVFALPDACLLGDATRARRIVARLQAEGAPPALLNFALARDLRSLIALLKGKGEMAAGVWRSRAPLFARARTRIPAGRLRDLHAAMVELDRAAKSRPEPVYWEELLNFVAVFSGGPDALGLPLAIHRTPHFS
ncbi:MAG: DNA polymerase III subunit delta [Oceanococcaceae bacterium]